MSIPSSIFPIVYFLAFFSLSSLLGQSERSYPRISPFEGVEWQEGNLKVKVGGEWHFLQKIEGVSKDSLVRFSQRHYAADWLEMIAEDLYEVMDVMGSALKKRVSVTLTKGGKTRGLILRATKANRDAILAQFNSIEDARKQIVTAHLTVAEAKKDIDAFTSLLEDYSAYQGLNGFDPMEALQKYRAEISDSILSLHHALRLASILGRIGDRHSSIRNYPIANDYFLPFSVAPLDGHIVALKYRPAESKFRLLLEEYPYLVRIDDLPIKEFLTAIAPRTQTAPPLAQHTRRVLLLHYMSRNYQVLGKPLAETTPFTFSNGVLDTTLNLKLNDNNKADIIWRDKFTHSFIQEPEAIDDQDHIQHFFQQDSNIAYVYLPEMVRPNEAGQYFKALDGFMGNVQESDALILDIRDNPGGSRDLIHALAPYLVHPDSTYIVNVAQQRGRQPIGMGYKSDLHRRSLFAYDELNFKEQKIITRFKATFDPMYELDRTKFSEPHYFILSGETTLSEQSKYFGKSVYILINEGCFSASSVLAAVYKGLPNISLAGVSTDGSSGNSEVFYLPHSHLRVRLSTMVSFQKDGRILDGYGTDPDIKLKRDMDQVLWKKDTQLENLKAFIWK